MVWMNRKQAVAMQEIVAQEGSGYPDVGVVWNYDYIQILLARANKTKRFNIKYSGQWERTNDSD
jgi:hypothetical protein